MEATNHDLADYVESLGDRQREALCGLLGLPPRAGRRSVCVRAAERCADLRGALDLLAKLGADEIELLLCWALRGQRGRDRALERLPQYTPDSLSGERWHTAWLALRQRGLCSSDDEAFDMLPCLQPVLAPFSLEQQLKIMRSSGDGQAPLAFCLAVAVGLVAAERTLVRADGALHSASVKRIERRLGPHGLAGMDPAAACSVLQQMGGLVLREQGNTRALQVDAGALEHIFRQEPRELAERALWQGGGHSLDLWTYARVRFAAESAPRTSEAPGASLEAIVAARIPRPHAGGHWDPLHAPDPWDVLHSLRTLMVARLVEALPHEGEVRFRPLQAPPNGTARAVVQPSFEVLVPWDAAPLAVARLGLFADLEQMDRVCRYRLSPSSVRRGVELLGGAKEILEQLEQFASGPLPQNVRVTLVGWAGEERPIRALRGDILVAAPAHLAALRRLAPTAREVSPGVLLLPAGALTLTIEAARDAGIPVMAPLRSDDLGATPAHRGPHPMAPLQHVATYLAQATREAPKAKTPSPKAPGRPTRFPTTFRELTRMLAADEEDEENEGDVEADGWGEPGSSRKPPWFPEAGPTKAPRHAPESEPAAPTWTAVLPGQLRGVLETAIELKATLRLMFRNSEGRSVDRRILPLRLKRTPTGEVVEAIDENHGGLCTLVLDRILAVAQV